MIIKKRNDSISLGIRRNISHNQVEEYIKSLPFSLTDDQLNAVNDCLNDLNSDKSIKKLIKKILDYTNKYENIEVLSVISSRWI